MKKIWGIVPIHRLRIINRDPFACNVFRLRLSHADRGIALRDRVTRRTRRDEVVGCSDVKTGSTRGFQGNAPGPLSLLFQPQEGLRPPRDIRSCSASGLIHDSAGRAPPSNATWFISGSFPHIRPTGMMRSHGCGWDVRLSCWMLTSTLGA